MKLKLVLSTTISLLFITGCSKSEHNADTKTVLPKQAIQSAALGSIEQCKSYTGLPTGWLKNTTAGMVFIPDGHFNFGSEKLIQMNLTLEKQREVKGFWIDQTEVTVAQFASFVKATGYITDAEKQKQAAVFLQTHIILSNGGNLRQDIHGKHQTAKWCSS